MTSPDHTEHPGNAGRHAHPSPPPINTNPFEFNIRTRRAAGARTLTPALRGDGVLDRNWEMPFGSMRGSMMAEIAFMEHLTHAWDLAKATGQAATLPAELVKECAETAAPMDAMLRMPGVCGPAVTVGDDASAPDKLIAFMGRQP